ncbi:MAG: DUF1080 domain-containing protein [Saprospiraceae bacterium]
MSLSRYLFLLFCLSFFACQTTSDTDSAANDPDREEWIALFNGRDLEGWEIKITGFPLGENYKNTFIVEDSILKINYDEYESFDSEFGHLYTVEPYSYYRLRTVYRFVGEQVPGGASWNVRNSGVMLHSQSAGSLELDQDFPVSVELQMLGGLEEGTERHTSNVCTPGTTVYTDGELNVAHCIDSDSKTYYGDQWVEVEAIVLGDSIIHHVMEGDTVLTYTKPQVDVDSVFINRSQDTPDWESFGISNPQVWIDRAGELLSEGHIALQAESHPIQFKTVELLNLKGCMDPKAKNYKSYFVKSDPGSCVY